MHICQRQNYNGTQTEIMKILYGENCEMPLKCSREIYILKLSYLKIGKVRAKIHFKQNNTNKIK